MTEQRLFGVWFCLLGVCCVVWPGQAQVPEPAQCLISGIYSLIRVPETKDEKSCRDKCFAEPDCHMAVVTKPLSGSGQCLLVNCLNQGNYSFPRDPSTEIKVYSKSTTDDEQRHLLSKHAYGLADERLRCFGFMNYSSCRSGIPRFFYNRTSYRCERFFSGCGSSSNTFDTQEGCEALCNEKFRCYRPSQYGGCSAQFSKFFYNVTGQRCERFDFSGCGSNGNIFTTVEECETLCSDVKGALPPVTTGITVTTTTQPAVNSETAATTSQPAVKAGTSPPVTSGKAGSPFSLLAVDSDLSVPVTNNAKAILCFVVPVFLLLLVFFVSMQRSRCSQHPSPISDRRHLLSDSDESVESWERFKEQLGH